MKIARLSIENFRGISKSVLHFPSHAVLIGDNNTGKSTVLEALDLALGPDRLARRPPVDEHDFYRGIYLHPVTPSGPAGSGKSSDAAVAPADIEKQGYVTAEVDEEGNIVGKIEELEAIVTEEAEDTSEETEQPQDGNTSSATKAQVETVGAPQIKIEVVITGLSSEQQSHFNHYIEWWNNEDEKLYSEPPVEGVDGESIEAAMRVTFVGWYDKDEDDFQGKTYFTRSLEEDPLPTQFRKKDKHRCGFLYLRSIRTGSRALSLEHGSLLDIILRIKEIRPQMWEGTISWLSSEDVASDPEIGISGVLKSINDALKKFVPKEWGIDPRLKVSALTRDHLRKVITAFVATGDGDHVAPYFRQGTGTLNLLVLAMLTQIAEGKQNVIFAMEEPETAIPPYAQKRIVHGIRELSTQIIITSHSPYVLEEFELGETLILSRTKEGVLSQAIIELPDSVKPKRYRQEFRTRFCEGLLARRILLAEGATEATSIPVAARRLSEIDPKKYASLEQLGVCTIDAGSDSMLADLGKLYRDIGKTVFAACDKQSAESEKLITASVDKLFMHNESDIEKLVLGHASKTALDTYCDQLSWPPHLKAKYPDPKEHAKNALSDFFGWAKGNWGLADFIASCGEADIPQWFKDICTELKKQSELSV